MGTGWGEVDQIGDWMGTGRPDHVCNGLPLANMADPSGRGERVFRLAGWEGLHRRRYMEYLPEFSQRIDGPAGFGPDTTLNNNRKVYHDNN